MKQRIEKYKGFVIRRMPKSYWVIAIPEEIEWIGTIVSNNNGWGNKEREENAFGEAMSLINKLVKKKKRHVQDIRRKTVAEVKRNLKKQGLSPDIKLKSI